MLNRSVDPVCSGRHVFHSSSWVLVRSFTTAWQWHLSLLWHWLVDCSSPFGAHWVDCFFSPETAVWCSDARGVSHLSGVGRFKGFYWGNLSPKPCSFPKRGFTDVCSFACMSLCVSVSRMTQQLSWAEHSMTRAKKEAITSWCRSIKRFILSWMCGMFWECRLHYLRLYFCQMNRACKKNLLLR